MKWWFEQSHNNVEDFQTKASKLFEDSQTLEDVV